jgi:hypothetical protein
MRLGPPRLGTAAHSPDGAEEVDRIDRYAAEMQAWQPWGMPCCGGAKTKAANDRAEQLGGTPAAIKAQVQRDLQALRAYKRTTGGKLMRTE